MTHMSGLFFLFLFVLFLKTLFYFSCSSVLSWPVVELNTISGCFGPPGAAFPVPLTSCTLLLITAWLIGLLFKLPLSVTMILSLGDFFFFSLWEQWRDHLCSVKVKKTQNKPRRGNREESGGQREAAAGQCPSASWPGISPFSHSRVGRLFTWPPLRLLGICGGRSHASFVYTSVCIVFVLWNGRNALAAEKKFYAQILKSTLALPPFFAGGLCLLQPPPAPIPGAPTEAGFFILFFGCHLAPPHRRWASPHSC